MPLLYISITGFLIILYMFPDVYVNVHVKTRNNTEVICSGQPSVVALIHIRSITEVT